MDEETSTNFYARFKGLLLVGNGLPAILLAAGIPPITIVGLIIWFTEYDVVTLASVALVIYWGVAHAAISAWTRKN